MTPTVPLNLFPLDGPANLLRWGAILDAAGRSWTVRAVRRLHAVEAQGPLVVETTSRGHGSESNWPCFLCRICEAGARTADGVLHDYDCPARLRGATIPLRGLALDAIARSTGVALGWPVTEDGPGPWFDQDDVDGAWVLYWQGRNLRFQEPDPAVQDATGVIFDSGYCVLPGISALSYAEALLAAARVVAAWEEMP